MPRNEHHGVANRRKYLLLALSILCAYHAELIVRSPPDLKYKFRQPRFAAEPDSKDLKLQVRLRRGLRRSHSCPAPESKDFSVVESVPKKCMSHRSYKSVSFYRGIHTSHSDAPGTEHPHSRRLRCFLCGDTRLRRIQHRVISRRRESLSLLLAPPVPRLHAGAAQGYLARRSIAACLWAANAFFIHTPRHPPSCPLEAVTTALPLL